MSLATGHKTGRVGQQGVNLLISELLAHGLCPYQPVLDDHGVDLMLSNGARLQVKTAHLSRSKRAINKGIYAFSCSRNVYITPGRDIKSYPGGRRFQNGIGWARREFAKECDFVVLIGLDERRFWIIPALVVDSRKETTLMVGPRPMPSQSEVKQLIDGGMEQTQVALELGVCTTTVWKYKKFGHSKRGQGVRWIRSYEDRWDLLGKYNQDGISEALSEYYAVAPSAVEELATLAVA